jgi:hypothetical protein
MIFWHVLGSRSYLFGLFIDMRVVALLGLRSRRDLISGQVDHNLKGRLDLSRFDAAPLIAFTAPKKTYYGTETYGRIPARCGAHRADQWAYHCLTAHA